MQAELFLPRQTNTGLYVQLHEAGFSAAQLTAAQRAYRLACRLFNGKYRKTERVFICHAVGAASSAAHFDSRFTFVLAAMLHAVYDSGQFPDGRIGGRSPSHRAWVSAQVGAEVESVLFRYQDFGFEKGGPEQYVQKGFDDADQDLMFIALAHEVDDLLDLGLRFASKYGESIESRVEACATLAERLGKPDLAATLRAHGRLYRDCEWTDDLKLATLHGYQIVPNLKAYLRHRFNHLRGRFVVRH
ncbi:MAG: hypothetical protein AB7Q29_05780 [Vicinamibacterales bacterium]